jgi:hypothetical protein
MALLQRPKLTAAGGSRGYDKVIIRDEVGTERSYSRVAYENLPLADRVRPLLEGRSRFLLDGEEVDPRVAIKGG